MMGTPSGHLPAPLSRGSGRADGRGAGGEGPERWAVVGGGLLGMTLAHRLAQAGRAVTLFDGAERLGGLASASGPLEAVPVSDWLRRWSGDRTFETIWLPLLKAKLGDHYRQTSAAFLWATIARMYAARRTGLKKEMFGYVPGGYARILGRFAEMLAGEGVEIRTGHAAERTTSVPGLHLVNAAHIVHGTLNVNATIHLADRAAERLCPRPSREGLRR